MTRLVFDGLPEGAHTFTYDEHGTVEDHIKKGDIVEVADLNDPKSPRARQCRDHIARGIARVLEETPRKKAAPVAG